MAMERNQLRPEWVDRDFSVEDDDVLPVNSAVYVHEGQYLFTGVIREVHRLRKPPHSIAVHYDGTNGTVVARLEYEKGADGYNEYDKLRAIYAPIEPESFALLWNGEPDTLHGLPSERITLHMTPGDFRLPIMVPPGIGALLYHDPQTDKFRFVFDERDSLEDAARLVGLDLEEAA